MVHDLSMLIHRFRSGLVIRGAKSTDYLEHGLRLSLTDVATRKGVWQTREEGSTPGASALYHKDSVRTPII